jgi:hypothetical protein
MISPWWVAYAKVHRHPELTEQTIWEVFEAERPNLVSYAGRFDGFHAVPASVSKTCLVRFDNNKYSVAASAVSRPVDVHAYADRIVIRQDGRIVAEHSRSIGRGETVYTRARSRRRRLSSPTAQCRSGWRDRHRQDTSGHRHWQKLHPSRLPWPLLQRRRSRQSA